MKADSKVKEYYRLAKPGIIYGNTMTAVAAFLFASRWHVDITLLLATMLGIAGVIGSACVFNNYLDRDIDARMARTKDRALARGAISGSAALSYATALGVLGFGLLFFFVNTLTTLVALIGFIVYVLLYTFSKRHSPLGTLVGSISGATPIVVGYTAVADRLDSVALLLFLILVTWQMPHFYAIAIRRLGEYSAAGIPVRPLVSGVRITKIQIAAYIVLYIFAVTALTVIGAAGYVYHAVTILSGVIWLGIAIQGFRTKNDTEWARKLFLFSLIVLLSFSVALALSPILW